ncbi:hypothetical protein BST23_06760 [Mycolicibacterium elephantis]|uniref:Uncharacterized protein n=1 Tax=Mycolicibacterium elephantis TaxID=81858 RepID=A0A1X0D538_9MYCO|nr:hypothetical protein BST23_06760 [Mycolicibacterium elephantis]
MTVTATGGAPFVVDLGGTLRANSSTERALRYCLGAVARRRGRTRLFSGEDDLPTYAPHELKRTPAARELIGALRDGELADSGVRSRLDMLATQLIAFARAAWETA